MSVDEIIALLSQNGLAVGLCIFFVIKLNKTLQQLSEALVKQNMTLEQVRNLVEKLQDKLLKRSNKK